jgi:hypothetical protein
MGRRRVAAVAFTNGMIERWPARTRFVAGVVHEALSVDDNRRVLDAVEAARRAVVDASSSCGLGRRTEATATQLLERTAQRCDD